MSSKHKLGNSVVFAGAYRFLSIFLLCGAFIFCAPQFATADPDPRELPSIVVGIPPLKYLVYSIAGDQALVSVVLPNNADPHTYEPSAIQMGIVGDSDYYFSIRLPFEEILLPKLQSSAPDMKVADISVGVERLPPMDDLHIDVTPPSPPPANATLLGGVGNLNANASEGASEEAVEEPAQTENPEGAEHEAAPEGSGHGAAEEGGHGKAAAEKGPSPQSLAAQAREDLLAQERSQPDPHIWLSPANMRILAKNVLEQLIQISPTKAELFTTNYNKFIAGLDSLDASIHALLDPLPPEQRTFLSFHPSWAYFARDYKLTQIAVEVKGYEPSPLLFAHIIDEAKARHVRTVLIEQQFSSALADTLIKELNANVVGVNSLALNWSDNLLKLAKILGNPPKIPEGFYDAVDSLSAQREAAKNANATEHAQ